MAIERTRSKRKLTGGRYVAYRKGRQHARVESPNLTKIDTPKVRSVRIAGGASKQKILQTNKINVATKGKVVQAELKAVIEHEADRNFVIRNIVSKGAIVDTSLGKVKVTSRPGQTGTLSGVLVEYIY